MKTHKLALPLSHSHLADLRLRPLFDSVQLERRCMRKPDWLMHSLCVIHLSLSLTRSTWFYSACMMCCNVFMVHPLTQNLSQKWDFECLWKPQSPKFKTKYAPFGSLRLPWIIVLFSAVWFLNIGAKHTFWGTDTKTRWLKFVAQPCPESLLRCISSKC